MLPIGARGHHPPPEVPLLILPAGALGHHPTEQILSDGEALAHRVAAALPPAHGGEEEV